MPRSFVAFPIPRIAVSLALLVGTAALAAPEPPVEFEPRVWALAFAVPDPAAAAAAYERGLGFTIERTAPSGAWCVLALGDARVVLRRGFEGSAAPGSPRLYLNMRVGDLEQASRRAQAAGFGEREGPGDIAIGRSLQLVDPGGNPVNLIDIEGDGMPADAAPGVFNAGVTVADMDAAETFFTRLGFTIYTRDYLPETLVFQRHGAIPLVLHPATVAESAGDAGALVLGVPDTDAAGVSLGSRGIHARQIEHGHWSGRPARVLDAPGGTLEIVDVPEPLSRQAASAR